MQCVPCHGSVHNDRIPKLIYIDIESPMSNTFKHYIVFHKIVFSLSE